MVSAADKMSDLPPVSSQNTMKFTGENLVLVVITVAKVRNTQRCSGAEIQHFS